METYSEYNIIVTFASHYLFCRHWWNWWQLLFKFSILAALCYQCFIKFDRWV